MSRRFTTAGIVLAVVAVLLTLTAGTAQASTVYAGAVGNMNGDYQVGARYLQYGVSRDNVDGSYQAILKPGYATDVDLSWSRVHDYYIGASASRPVCVSEYNGYTGAFIRSLRFTAPAIRGFATSGLIYNVVQVYC